MLRIFNQYVSAKSILLMALESGLISLAVLGSVRLRFHNSRADFETYTVLPDFALQVLAYIIVFELCFYYNDLYDLTVVRQRRDQIVRLGQSLGSGSLVLGFVYFALPDLMIRRGVFFVSIAMVAAFLISGRVLLDRVWQFAAPVQRVLIIGTGDLAATVQTELANRDDLGIEITGFFAAPCREGADVPHRISSDSAVIGAPETVLEAAERLGTSRVIVAIEDYRGSLPIRELVRLRVKGIRIEDAQSALASLTGRIWISAVRPSWFVFSGGFRRSKFTSLLKRCLDIIFSGCGLLTFAPVMGAVALAVRLDSPGPILYRQVRVGWMDRNFSVLKFRSMRNDAEKDGLPVWAAANDPRVTRIGKYLRKFRLDELPQFINVLRGDMSFVGPRPERPDFVEKLRELIPFYDERHSVRPGLTGWAQVQYPYGASVEDATRKLEYDLFYLKNMSFFFDCAIVFQTVRTVLFGRGGR